MKPNDLPMPFLSRVWGKDEIRLEQVAGPNGLLPEGVAAGKVRGACQQALHDSLDYVWVDTCCIDMSSSAQLSEAINSMFRWYEDSEICDVFLADVSTLQDLENDWIPQSSSQLYQSRWHTHGWALQELLDPKAVHAVWFVMV
ncbi:Vegetative incompatibility protein HET-E-1 [Apiospora saccharicola]|uniref:Vegetative incompatibility protein HET-E-1 n=1 Tax=Apiospora saccharicola TaxID=335842 RepID=A0ABR1W366_9PEZI